MSATEETDVRVDADFYRRLAARKAGPGRAWVEKVEKAGKDDPDDADPAEASVSLAAEPDAPAEVDVKAATARFPISSPTKDRHGDVVVARGCEEHLARFLRNPVVFFGHKSYGLPIATAANADGTLALELGDDRIHSTARFHLKTQESEDVFRLVEAGVLRAASIGFIPHSAKVVRRKDPPEDAPRNVLDFDPWVKLTFTKWELIEWSVVAIPANPDCVRSALSKGFGGRGLSDPVRRYLEPFALPAAVVVAGGWEAPKEVVRAEKTGPKVVAADAPALARVARSLSAVEAAAAGAESPWAKGYLAAVAKAAADARDEVIKTALAEFPGHDFAAEPAATVPPTPAPEPAKSVAPVLSAPPAPAPASPPAASPEVVRLLGDLLARVKHLAELQQANAAALRRVTGRLD